MIFPLSHPQTRLPLRGTSGQVTQISADYHNGQTGSKKISRKDAKLAKKNNEKTLIPYYEYFFSNQTLA
jgi:hypothetical protein